MKTKEPLSYRGKYLLLAVMPVYFMIAGLFCQPVDEIFSGLIAILREPDFLITDYFVVGGVSAAFFNAGTITLILLVFLYCIRMEFDGHTITSCCLLFGFSLFGKNLLNIWRFCLVCSCMHAATEFLFGTTCMLVSTAPVFHRSLPR